MKKPLILVTNDDGMFAPGIKALVEVVRNFGDVVVVAPNSPQSGKGHAVSLEEPLRLNKVDVFEGIDAYECSGTPVDCVKLAKHVLLKDRLPDLCVSGINHGSNASINIIYSGTMSAAMEASLEGIQSVGFSLLDYSMDADMTTAKFVVAHVVEYMLAHGLRETLLLNVNIPIVAVKDLAGFKVCRQAEARWVEDFVEATDPRGQKYYWLTGKFVNLEQHEDTDIWALRNSYVSIVPSMHDLTAHSAIRHLKGLEKPAIK